jgi:hypothetical protein
MGKQRRIDRETPPLAPPTPTTLPPRVTLLVLLMLLLLLLLLLMTAGDACTRGTVRQHFGTSEPEKALLPNGSVGLPAAAVACDLTLLLLSSATPAQALRRGNLQNLQLLFGHVDEQLQFAVVAVALKWLMSKNFEQRGLTEHIHAIPWSCQLNRFPVLSILVSFPES